jgi:hypothetical protein
VYAMLAGVGFTAGCFVVLRLSTHG